MKKRSQIVLGFMALCALGGTALANNFLEVEKNVAVHGSLDDKGERHLFLVLGLKPGTEGAARLLKDAIDQGLVHEISDEVWDREHKKDFVGATKDGVITAKDLGVKLIHKPFEDAASAKKVLDADIVAANEAYYKGENSRLEGIKYAGKMAFVGVKGTYFMVVKPGAQFVGYASGSALALPAHVTWQFLSIGAKGAWFGVKFTAKTLAAAVVEVYSIVSSAVAVTIVGVANATYQVFHFAKNLGQLPHNHEYPLRTLFQSQVTPDHCEKATEQLVQFLKGKNYEPVSKYDAKHFSSDTTILNGDVLIRAYPHNGKIVVSIEARRTYKGLKDKSKAEKAEIKNRLEQQMLALVHEFEQVLGSQLVTENK